MICVYTCTFPVNLTIQIDFECGNEMSSIGNYIFTDTDQTSIAMMIAMLVGLQRHQILKVFTTNLFVIHGSTFILFTMEMRNCYIILFLGIFETIIECYRFEPNTFEVKNFTGCPGDENNAILFHRNWSLLSRNRYGLEGEVKINETVFAPVEVFQNFLLTIRNSTVLHNLKIRVAAKRCDFNMTHCESYDQLIIRDVCRILDLENQLWTDFMKHAEPKFKCPIKQSIKIQNATIDLGYISYLPFDGYTWFFSIKAYRISGIKSRRRKQMLYCGICEIIVTKHHPERKKVKNSEKDNSK